MGFSLRGLLRAKPPDGTQPAPAGAKRRNFYGDLKPHDAGGDPLFELLKGDTFASEQSYFSVRLVEMRLASAGNYIVTYLPMCACFLQYTYGTERRSVPFVVDYQMIRSGLGNDQTKAGAQNIEFKNVYVIRNAPMKADGLAMFAALCRVADSGFARGMLNLLADAVGTVGGPAVATVVRTGVDMTTRLGSLLGADGVTTRFGVFDGAALTTSGYRVIAGADSAALAGTELVMESGQLKAQAPGGGAGQTIDDVDYLVLALEYRKTLVDDAFGQASSLPFHALWEPVKTKLLSGDLDGANQAYRELTVRIAGSPDLVEADRISMMLAYRGQLERWKKAALDVGTKLLGEAPPDVTTALRALADHASVRPRLAVAKLVKVAGQEITRLKEDASVGKDVALDPDCLAVAAKRIRASLKFDEVNPAHTATTSSHLMSTLVGTAVV